MKIKLFILVSILLTLQTYSQNSGEFEWGFFAGPSLSSISNNESLVDTSSKLGFNAGLFGTYHISEQWGVRTKLYYDQKGFDNVLLQATNATTKKGSITFRNVTVPLMAYFKFGSNNNWFVNAGPYVSQLLTAEASEGVSEQKGLFNKTDIGAEGGFGYTFSLSEKNKNAYFIEYSGQFGFTDLLKENDFDSVTNTRHSINLGFRF